jgi:fructokinase
MDKFLIEGNKKYMGILCVGEALIDMICTDKGSALSDGNHFLKKAGGAPTNVAAAIAALGGTVSIAAKVGNDPFGKHLRDQMLHFGVDTRWMLSDPNHFTTFAFVSLMQNGERDFVFNRGADGELSKEDVKEIPLDEISIIHFGSATGFLPGPLQAAYLYLLSEARKKGIFTSFDPNYRHLLFPGDPSHFIAQSRHFLQHCDFFKMSDEEALLITGCADLSEATRVLMDLSTAVFAITLGKEGTLLCINRESFVIPSIPINPIDTTGAGDAFVGALLFQLSNFSTSQMNQLSVEQWKAITANANKAGARTCEFMGAMEAFEHLTDQIFQ